jgi:hypothetical protein
MMPMRGRAVSDRSRFIGKNLRPIGISISISNSKQDLSAAFAAADQADVYSR